MDYWIGNYLRYNEVWQTDAQWGSLDIKMMQSSALKHSSKIVLYYSERCLFNNLFKKLSFNTLFPSLHLEEELREVALRVNINGWKQETLLETKVEAKKLGKLDH